MPDWNYDPKPTITRGGVRVERDQTIYDEDGSVREMAVVLIEERDDGSTQSLGTHVLSTAEVDPNETPANRKSQALRALHSRGAIRDGKEA